MPTILEKIVQAKRQQIAADQTATPLSELESRLADAPPVRDFREPLSTPGKVSLIAEVKRASPSKGIIRQDFDPVAIARDYERGGADCQGSARGHDHDRSFDHTRGSPSVHRKN